MHDRQAYEWTQLDFPTKVALKSKCEESFLSFTRVFFELIQGDVMLVNWHHRYMADAVERLIQREIPNLIINIPPGGTKTEFFSIHLPAYLNVLVSNGFLDRFRNLNVSYADTLVRRNSRRTRDIIASLEYQELWPCQFGVNQAEEWTIEDELGKAVGETVSKSAGGQLTGGRGGFFGEKYSGHVMLDDYNKPEDMFSETKRNSGNRKAVNTLRSRRGDKSKLHPTPFISVQQRLHKLDITGFMKSGGMGIDFHQIKIPALVCMDYINTLPEQWRDQCLESISGSESVIVGGVEYWSYWPEMEDVNDLLALWERDEYTFLSQYMQNPKELSGGLMNTDWLQRYSVLPSLQWRGVYVDTNSGKVKDHNDYTVFTHAGTDGDGNIFIIDVVRGKYDPSDLLDMAVSLWDKWKGYEAVSGCPLRYMAIEDKQAGQGLITSLKRRHQSIFVKEIPRGADQNKLIRCKNSIPAMKAGNVHIPETFDDNGAPVLNVNYSDGSHAAKTGWVLSALKEVADFSYDDSHDNDDIVDTWFDAIEDMIVNEGSGAVGVLLPKRYR